MATIETKVEAGIKQRDEVTVQASIPADPPEVVAAKERATKKKQLVSILERGIVDDRLKVDLPDDLHGQWVRNDRFSIDRLKSLGFREDTEYAPKRGLHSDGTGRAQIADVVHMICDRETHEIIEEIKKEQFIAAHGTPSTIAGKTARELMEYQAELANQTGNDIPLLNQSSQRAVKASELAETLKTLDKQQGG